MVKLFTHVRFKEPFAKIEYKTNTTQKRAQSQKMSLRTGNS